MLSSTANIGAAFKSSGEIFFSIKQSLILTEDDEVFTGFIIILLSLGMLSLGKVFKIDRAKARKILQLLGQVCRTFSEYVKFLGV